MNSVLKNELFGNVYIDKRMVKDSLDLMDDQLKWMEQKLTITIDNLVHDQFFHLEKELKELEIKINEQLNEIH